MSLRSDALALYRRGWPDTAIHAALVARGPTAAGLRSVMSKARRELGITLRPDLCLPRSQRQRVRRTNIGIAVLPHVADALAATAHARGLACSTLVGRLVEAAVTDGLVDVVLGGVP